MNSPKLGIVALVVQSSYDPTDPKKSKNGLPEFVDAISDDHEIAVLEAALNKGEIEPLDKVAEFREQKKKEDEEFGDYVEELLSHPFLRPEIQEQGLQWLKSKIKVEQYQRSEMEATKVIASYAYKIFQEDPKRREFLLAGTHAMVKIKVLKLPDKAKFPQTSQAA